MKNIEHIFFKEKNWKMRRLLSDDDIDSDDETIIPISIKLKKEHIIINLEY